jgi:hypothetical protein
VAAKVRSLGAGGLATNSLVGHPTILPREGTLIGEGHRHRAVGPISPWPTPNGVLRSAPQCVVANRILFKLQRVITWTEVRVRPRA